MDIIEYIKNTIFDKKILILGFGREGRSTYKLIKKVGGYKALAIADLNKIEDVPEKVYCGADYQDAICQYDLVYKSPGVVLADMGNKHKITSQTDAIIDCFKYSMIGITGTKGKSTTTSLIYHILDKCGKNPVLMGNIGIPAFEAAENITEDQLIVYELSCHQLEFAQKSPHRGVLLNIYPEHLDHYGTFQKYAMAKQNIYKNMTKDDFLVCGYEFMPHGLDVNAISVSMTSDGADFVVSDQKVFDSKNCIEFAPDAKVFGIHNMYNIAVAYAVCTDCGITADEFLAALKSYEPLPHRLELFADINGVRYFDDSISTIPETAIKALQSVNNVQSVILGGMDRGVELDSLCEYLLANPVENVILLPDTGYVIYDKLIDKYKFNLFKVKDLQEAVLVAKKVSHPGTACVLSPAAASYGFFKNFEERGDFFKKFVLES